METLLLNSNSKKDLTMLLNLAKEIGLDLVVAPKTKLKDAQKASNSKISKQEMIMQLSKEVNKNMTKKLLEMHNIKL